MNIDINTILALIIAFTAEEEEAFDYMKLLETLTTVLTKLIELFKTVQAM